MYVAPNISITGELDFFKIPSTIDERYQAHYFDFDLYGTVNFNDFVGAQVGWRSLDLGYVFEDDHGNFKAKGLYFGGSFDTNEKRRGKTNNRAAYSLFVTTGSLWLRASRGAYQPRVASHLSCYTRTAPWSGPPCDR